MFKAHPFLFGLLVVCVVEVMVEVVDEYLVTGVVAEEAVVLR